MINFLTRKIARGRLDKFIEQEKTDEQILDLGSHVSPYKKWFPNRKSLDINPESGADIIADAHNIPLPDNSVDRILCTEMLEHMYDPKKAVSEIHRILKLGGTVVLTTRFMYGLHDAPHDYFRYTKYGLRELFKNFEILELKEETTNFITMGALLQRFVYQTKFIGGSLGDKLFKIFFLGLAKFLTLFNFLVKEQYADIRKSHVEDNVFATGYFLKARKK